MSNRQYRAVEILLVEDNPGDVYLIREALRDSKIHNALHVAEDGEEAMAYLMRQGDYTEVHRPDLVLLDLNLPKKDGYEVLNEIKNDEKLKDIPVVILTTSHTEEDILKSYRLHANCYITKPVDFNQFIKVVRSIEDFWFSIVKLPSYPDNVH
jgi:two-component system response regulator